jgi:hypothetical protein
VDIEQRDQHQNEHGRLDVCLLWQDVFRRRKPALVHVETKTGEFLTRLLHHSRFSIFARDIIAELSVESVTTTPTPSNLRHMWRVAFWHIPHLAENWLGVLL